jgi:hypothetical protein
VVSAPSAVTVSQPITGKPLSPAALSVDDYDFGAHGPFVTHTMPVTNTGALAAKIGIVQLANPTLSGFVIAVDRARC